MKPTIIFESSKERDRVRERERGKYREQRNKPEKTSASNGRFEASKITREREMLRCFILSARIGKFRNQLILYKPSHFRWSSLSLSLTLGKLFIYPRALGCVILHENPGDYLSRSSSNPGALRSLRGTYTLPFIRLLRIRVVYIYALRALYIT